MKEDYLSDLTKVEIRKLFVERLLNNCDTIFYKKFNVFDIDYGDDEVIKLIIDKLIDKNEVYEEIILAMTSKELDTVEEILTELGYDNSIYVAVKNNFKDMPNLI